MGNRLYSNDNEFSMIASLNYIKKASNLLMEVDEWTLLTSSSDPAYQFPGIDHLNLILKFLLIISVMYPEFLAASRLESWERRLLSVQRLLSIMECYVDHPEYRAHRATLRYLATHLARVASRRHVNRMTPYNLALVFAPNLIQSCEDSPKLFIQDSKFKIWVWVIISNESCHNIAIFACLNISLICRPRIQKSHTV